VNESALKQSKTAYNEIEYLIQRIRKRRVIPWLGAGITYPMYFTHYHYSFVVSILVLFPSFLKRIVCFILQIEDTEVGKML
jgi:hypothetical protein